LLIARPMPWVAPVTIALVSAPISMGAS